MSNTTVLTIGNALPHADAGDSARILALWQSIAGYFATLDFSAKAHHGGPVGRYQVTLDATHLVRVMTRAVKEHGSFDACRAAYIADAGIPVSCDLGLTITAQGEALDDLARFEVATVFLQQLVLAANLSLPGSIQILSPVFKGDKGHLVEPCIADALILGHARALLRGLGPDKDIDFGTAWRWLENTGISQSHTAIKDIEKILFTLLKVAEQRQEYGARAVLLVIYQLELLAGCQADNDLGLLRRRLRMLLGAVPEELDCLRELFSVRAQLLGGTQPVRRPALLRHTGRDELDEELGRHNNAVVAATTLVLALLRKLIAANAQRFVFTESVTLE